MEGKNTLTFVFKSSAEEAVRRAKAYPYKVPYVAVRPLIFPCHHEALLSVVAAEIYGKFVLENAFLIQSPV